MSVCDVDSIDYIGINILFKRVYIGILDELDWHDDARHRNLLTRKIDRCISYIRSGQLLSSYPKVRSYDIAIEYVSTHVMTQAAKAFWNTREELIRAAGYDVRAREVDVRHSLRLPIDEPAEPAPAALEVLEAEPLHSVNATADVSFLPPPPKPLHRRTMPVLARLVSRRASSF